MPAPFSEGHVCGSFRVVLVIKVDAQIAQVAEVVPCGIFVCGGLLGGELGGMGCFPGLGGPPLGGRGRSGRTFGRLLTPRGFLTVAVELQDDDRGHNAQNGDQDDHTDHHQQKVIRPGGGIGDHRGQRFLRGRGLAPGGQGGGGGAHCYRWGRCLGGGGAFLPLRGDVGHGGAGGLGGGADLAAVGAADGAVVVGSARLVIRGEAGGGGPQDGLATYVGIDGVLIPLIGQRGVLLGGEGGNLQRGAPGGLQVDAGGLLLDGGSGQLLIHHADDGGIAPHVAVQTDELGSHPPLVQRLRDAVKPQPFAVQAGDDQAGEALRGLLGQHVNAAAGILQMPDDVQAGIRPGHEFSIPALAHIFAGGMLGDDGFPAGRGIRGRIGRGIRRRIRRWLRGRSGRFRSRGFRSCRFRGRRFRSRRFRSCGFRSCGFRGGRLRSRGLRCGSPCRLCGRGLCGGAFIGESDRSQGGEIPHRQGKGQGQHQYHG